MAEPFATVADITALWRPLSEAEKERAEALLPVVSDSLRQEAIKVGKDLDQMLADGEMLEMTSTDSEPMTQFSESALGYSASGTFLVPGGGLFIKTSELARLGLRRQKYGVIDLWQSDCTALQ